MKRLLVPLLAALALPTVVNAQLYQYIDDFENSTTWKLNVFSSKNKMPYDSPILDTNPVLKWQIEKKKDYKTPAELKLTCKKYIDNYKSTEYDYPTQNP